MNGLIRGVIVVLGVFFTLSSFAGGRFIVPAPPESSTHRAYIYDSETGELFKKNANREDLTPIPAFGRIPGLTDSELYVISFEDGQGTLLVRHGPWMSIVRPGDDRPVAANIGPAMSEDGFMTLQTYVTPDEGRIEDSVYIFSADSYIRGQGAQPLSSDIHSLIFIVKQNGEIYWFPFRDDVAAGRLRITMPHAEVLKISGTGQHRMKVAGHVVTVDLQLKASVHLDSLTVVSESVGAGDPALLLTGNKLIRSTNVQQRGLQILRSPEESRVSALRPMLPVATQDLLRKASPFDDTARNLAIQEARARIEYSRSLADRVRQALSGLRGQEEAVEQLARITAAMPSAERFQVTLLGGPTGVGKTWAAELLAKVVAPDAEQPLYRISFNEHREASFLNSLIFGPGPGYVGSDSLSTLAAWLLSNPERGVLLFDELDKAKEGVAEVLQTFLDRGEVTIAPHLVTGLLKKYEKVEKEKWPVELRRQTNDGRNAETAITLKLTNFHQILVATNAGAEIFTGAGKTGLEGRRLTSDQDIISGNARLSRQTIDDSLRARGYTDDFRGRFQNIVPFKVIVGEHFRSIVSDRINAAVDSLEKEFIIDLDFDTDALSFLESEAYNPLGGARNIRDNIDSWFKKHVLQALNDGRIAPGSRVRVSVVRGGRTEPSFLELRADGASEPASRFVAGRPLPPRPVELLERAKKNLIPVLERRIIGHREEIRQIADAIIAQLQEAVDNPDKAGRPVVIYLDSTPGIGKTEIAKGVAEALFDSADSLADVLMNQITTEEDFFNVFVNKLSNSARARPDAMVALLDEFPRAGQGGYRQVVQNHLLSVLDEGRLPSRTRGEDGVRLPTATVFIATGNLLEAAFPGGEFMTNRQLQTSFRGLKRHPESLRSLFEQAFVGALRSRLGDPILLSPLTDEQVAELRIRFFAEIGKQPALKGINLTLGESAVKFFEREYIPIRGGRWVRINMEKFVRVPLLSIAARRGQELQGAEIRVEFNESTRKMMGFVKKPGQTEWEAVPLAEIPRGRTEYHPEAVARTAMKTSIHEMGHAIVWRALYGQNAVEEVSTFGGGEGGVTYLGVNTPTYSMYNSAAKGPYRLAMFLAGHVAEVLFTNGDTSEGASSDFERSRDIAQTMLRDGSTLSLAPFPMLRNGDGKFELSERNRQLLEDQQAALLKFSAEVAREILTLNADLVVEAAQKLHEHSDMTFSKAEFEALMKDRLVTISEARIRELAGIDRVTQSICADLLGTKKTFWQRVKAWFKGLRNPRPSQSAPRLTSGSQLR